MVTAREWWSAFEAWLKVALDVSPVRRWLHLPEGLLWGIGSWIVPAVAVGELVRRIASTPWGVAAFVGSALIVAVLGGVRVQLLRQAETHARQVMNLLLDAVPADPLGTVTDVGDEVWLIALRLTNLGPQGDFRAVVVNRSVRGVRAIYPDAGSFALRWQQPNDREEWRTMLTNTDAGLEVAYVVPAAGRVAFLGPRGLRYRLFENVDHHVTGQIEVQDRAHNARLQWDFVLSIAPEHPVELRVTGCST